MTAVPNRAQNYIPISKKNKMKFAAEPRRIKTQKGNIAYLDDRRIQKQSVNFERPGYASSGPSMSSAAAARKIAAQGARNYPTSANTAQTRKISYGTASGASQQRNSAQSAAQQRKTASGYSYNRMMQGGRVSAQGEIAIPIPRTNARQEREIERTPSARAVQKPVGVVSTILLIAAIFGILSFLMVRNATISDIGLENANIQKNITTLTQNLGKMNLDITLKEDLNSIQQRAAGLNMTSPQSGQITYLPEDNTAVQNAAVTQDTQDTASNESSFSLSNLFKDIKNWFG